MPPRDTCPEGGSRRAGCPPAGRDPPAGPPPRPRLPGDEDPLRRKPALRQALPNRPGLLRPHQHDVIAHRRSLLAEAPVLLRLDRSQLDHPRRDEDPRPPGKLGEDLQRHFGPARIGVGHVQNPDDAPLLVDFQPPRRRRQGRHRRLQGAERHPPIQRSRDAAQNVGEIPAPQELRFEHLRIPCSGDDPKATATRADRHVHPPDGEISDGGIHTVEQHALPLGPGARRQSEAHRIVGVHHGRRPRRQGGQQFVFRFGDPLRGAEPFQVLHADRRENAQRRAHDVAHLADLPGTVGRHLHHEDLVVVPQFLPNDAGDPHGSVHPRGVFRTRYRGARRSATTYFVLVFP